MGASIYSPEELLFLFQFQGLTIDIYVFPSLLPVAPRKADICNILQAGNHVAVLVIYTEGLSSCPIHSADQIDIFIRISFEVVGICGSKLRASCVAMKMEEQD